jgi:flagellar basal-body rod protein FlgF
MDAATYKALSGAVVQMRRLDVATQDLANVNTAGYKGQRLAFAEVLASRSRLLERVGGFVGVHEQRTNFSQGDVQRTGNPLNLALEGDGYFAVRTVRGERYTRHGNFTLAADGTVITASGEALLGEAGPIRLSGSKVEVSADGTVTTEEGEGGKLRIVRFADARAVVKEGANLLNTAPRNVQAATDVRVFQGSLEQSNVSPIDGMVSLIAINRQYEAYERAMRLMDSATAKMISEGAR